jgi:hypothetical protein
LILIDTSGLLAALDYLVGKRIGPERTEGSGR